MVSSEIARLMSDCQYKWACFENYERFQEWNGRNMTGMAGEIRDHNEKIKAAGIPIPTLKGVNLAVEASGVVVANKERLQLSMENFFTFQNEEATGKLFPVAVEIPLFAYNACDGLCGGTTCCVYHPLGSKFIYSGKVTPNQIKEIGTMAENVLMDSGIATRTIKHTRN